MQKHAFEAIGTHFEITIWDELPPHRAQAVLAHVEQLAHDFDALYSRFKHDSLVSKLAKTTGSVAVPLDLVEMLRLYSVLYGATDGKFTPTIASALEDVGYDAKYSLVAKEVVRPVPQFDKAITIVSDTELVLHEEVLLDLGAVGKGYLVDRIYDYLHHEGIGRFLVNGSGDIRYYSVQGEPIVCGLEHPLDEKQVIGTLELNGGALCASAINRRQWGEYNHYIDPTTGTSPSYVLATWVQAPTAALADAYSSALFFTDPLLLTSHAFEYLVMNRDLHIKKSAGFTADFFTETGSA